MENQFRRAGTAMSGPLARIGCGIIAIAIVTAICFRLRFSLAPPLCLDLIIVILLSLGGSFAASAAVSLIAVGTLDYYFTQPLYSVFILDPADGFAVALFLISAAVVTTLVSRLRQQASRLALVNARLQEQIAEVEHAQNQVNLARLNRVMLMGEMTASIAHEVNQPLTGILANSGTALRYLAREVPEIEMARKLIDLIVRDGKRASSVVARIRELTRKAPPRIQYADINAIISDAIAFTIREIQAKDIEVTTRLDAGLPPVAVDPVQIQQVILNLVVNAIEAMTDERSGPRELLVASGEAESAIFVEVRDAGPGLAPGAVGHVFDSFFTTKPEGMGMGLSLSRSIVEAHGGRLSALDNEPVGAIFRFTVPIGTARG
jgi:signal transduction histidine kinase